MNKNPLLKIQDFRQSIWLDFIRREIITSGKLKRLIVEDGLRGVTSNPAIFEKAINESDDYSSEVRALIAEGKSSEKIYETMAVEDIQRAADEFRPAFDSLDGRDGFVSLEVSPLLARDTEGTIDEARRLWSELNRPNVFIKVPATKEGLPAIRQLISEGINVNVTLLFSLDRYREVADAYISGLEGADRSGHSLSRIASVASFFLSRIDVLVDPMLQSLVDSGGDKAKKEKDLVGEVAIASAKIAYQIYREIYSTDRWRKLADKGARTQRLLWASTSTKNPDYEDVKYVEPLIGPDTVNTLPMDTLEAYRDHGKPAARLDQDVDKAQKALDTLAEVGIDLRQVTEQLEDEGIEKFAKPFNQLLAALEKKRDELAVHQELHRRGLDEGARRVP
jgi:transaldolase